MSRESRTRKLHQYNVAWLGAIAVAVVLVAVCVIGLATTSGSGEPGETGNSARLTVFVVLGGLGAVIGLVSTIVRAKGGDEVDEADLDTPPDAPQRPLEEE